MMLALLVRTMLDFTRFSNCDGVVRNHFYTVFCDVFHIFNIFILIFSKRPLVDIDPQKDKNIKLIIKLSLKHTQKYNIFYYKISH